MPPGPPAQLGEFAHRGFQLESEVHNQDREDRSELFFQGRASRLPAIQNLTDRTISAVLQW